MMNIEIRHRRTTVNEIIAETRYTFRDVKRSQSQTAIESPMTDGCYAIGNLNIIEFYTTSKCILTDCLKMRWHFDGFQITASIECPEIYTPDAFGKNDRCQAGTAFKYIKH